jgi:hypothetical protein
LARKTQLIAASVCAIILLLVLGRHHFSHAKPGRAFYYWKTQWRMSPEIDRNLAQNHIDRLYMRFFDVEWDEAVHAPQPVAPLRFESATPAGVEVVPVVYIVNAVFLKIEYTEVAALADHVWMKVSRMAGDQGIAFQQLQLDCDWSESSRRNYFHFVDLLNRKLKAQHKIVSTTLRLHQIKYPERTGIPPVSLGMLMFYNFGRIQADSARSSIFNPEDAARYSSYIAGYPLKLDLVLPAFSWSVHSREGRVLGLLENLSESEIAAFRVGGPADCEEAAKRCTELNRTVGPTLNNKGFSKLSANRYSATRSVFFRGRYFMIGDLLVLETTTPDVTRQAAVLAKRGAGWNKAYGTVALFDLDDKHLKDYSGADIESILAQF